MTVETYYGLLTSNPKPNATALDPHGTLILFIDFPVVPQNFP